MIIHIFRKEVSKGRVKEMVSPAEDSTKVAALLAYHANMITGVQSRNAASLAMEHTYVDYAQNQKDHQLINIRHSRLHSQVIRASN